MSLLNLNDRVIGAAIEVHKALGPGFLESIYESALCLELERRDIVHERQKRIPVLYQNIPVGEHRLDLLIEGKLVVELKAISAIEPIHFATVRSYLKAMQLQTGLILNFAQTTLEIKRVGREFTQREG